MRRSDRPRCVQCGKLIPPGRGEFLFQRQTGKAGELVEEWLCGRPRCAEAYNNDEPPKK